MRILGIFRGFPGLGRVVAGVSLLEELRDQYGANIRMIVIFKVMNILSPRAMQICTKPPPWTIVRLA